MRLYTGGAKTADAKANLPGDSLCAAGDMVLPRYLAAPGDHEIALGQYVLLASSPGSLGGPFLPQLAASVKVLSFLDLQAIVGPWTRIGARGPILTGASAALGWSADYRADLVAVGRTLATGEFHPGVAPPGTSPPVGFWSVPGVAVARGGEIRLDGLSRTALDAGFLDLGLSPFGYFMMNRAGGGADLTVDWALERFTIGYTGTAQYNVLDPFVGTVGAVGITPLELRHGVGAKILVGERNMVQVGYRFVQADAYGNSLHLLTCGLGFRSAPAPVAESEADSEAGSAATEKMRTAE